MINTREYDLHPVWVCNMWREEKKERGREKRDRVMGRGEEEREEKCLILFVEVFCTC